MKIFIIGAGAWGTALAIVAAKGGNRAALLCHDANVAENIKRDRKNPLLPGIKLPGRIKITANIRDGTDSDVWLVAVPAEFFRQNMRDFRQTWNGQTIIICTKGIEQGTNYLMSEILKELRYPVKKCGVLSGPQFANDVAQNIPTGATIGGPPDVFKTAQSVFPDMYLENTNDTTGVQLCGAGKNAVALIAGFLSGQGASESEKAMTISHAWGEIVELGRKMGAKPETFLMLCGSGDLLLTATSTTSRNFSAGTAMARGNGIGGATLEGIAAIHGLAARAKALGLRTPILERWTAVYT